MTKFMKFELLSYCGLKIFGYILGIFGFIGIVGFVGSLEHDSISIAQFLVYEIHAFGLIGLSYLIYRFRELIKKDFIKRDRLITRGQKIPAHN